VQSIARQGRGDNDGVTLDDLLAATTGGPPRFFSPITSGTERVTTSTIDAATKPRMVYVPGLDGTGFAASAQFERLAVDFELVCLNVPVGDRSSFHELVTVVCEYLERDSVEETQFDRTNDGETKGKRTYLLGESMGGLIALGVAQRRPDLVNDLILVNPASSFDRSPWPAIGPLLPLLPEQMYAGLPYALAPVLFDPPRLLEGAIRAAAAGAGAGAGADALASPAGLAAAAEELARLFPALGQLSSIIPRDTLAHRLNVLAEGCASVNAPGALERLGAFPDPSSSSGPDPPSAKSPRGDRKPKPPRVLAIVSDADALIPSADEGTRLKRRMPRGCCVVETLEGASHAALQEAGVDLVNIMRENGFGPRRATDPDPLSKDPKFVPPSTKELRVAFEGLNGLRSSSRPCSSARGTTDPVVPGLSAVPFEEGRPVLLVGNHQTIAPDLGFIIEAFIKERGVLPRGLAHPVVAGGGRVRRGREPCRRRERREKKTRTVPSRCPSAYLPRPARSSSSHKCAAWQDAVAASARDAAETSSADTDGGAGAGLSQFSRFGAVPVSGKNLYKLLAAGECVLLFPGGVREAFKRKGEKYALFWPSKPEFVRMAARHGAVIVPFAAVGAEDGFDVVADADDVSKLPFGVGDALMARARDVPSARAVDTRVTRDGQAEEAFVQPLIVPRVPERYYFKFGKPIYTGELFSEKKKLDEAAEARLVDETYAACRAGVEDGIDWLLVKRSEDPFLDTPGRVIWEAASGKQAPTFTP
jgi:pimeloyl-ACP methyl ester carboxylesterase/1-acyl-sn-glycerol-3-phosphate acyltransferase